MNLLNLIKYFSEHKQRWMKQFIDVMSMAEHNVLS